MTTKAFPATVDFSSIELATGADIPEHENETIPTAGPNTLLNTSTLYDSGSNALTSAAYITSSKPFVVAEINATASTHGESLIFHNATTVSSNLTEPLTLSASPVTHQRSSSRIIEFLTSEHGRVDTETFDFESTTQLQEAVVADENGSTVAIAVGVSVAVVVLVVSVLVVVFVCLRRKRLRLPKGKKQSGPVMENPQYTERASTLPKNFDLMMHTGPMMRDQLTNNSSGNTTKTNGKRKKDAPRPPIYKPTAGGDTTSKRKAPPPPPPEYPRDLYERDSGAGSSEALELSSFGNQNADPASAENENSQSKPLLESFHPQKKSPKRSSKVDPDEKAIEVNASKDEDEEEDDANEEMKTTLLSKDKAESSLSLDSYDKTKNPFFSS